MASVWRLAFGLFLAVGVLGSFRSSRHATNRPCSLFGVEVGDDPENACRLDSTLNASDSRLGVMFGETNCTAVMTSCQPKLTYWLLDWTRQMPTDRVDRPLPTSIFSSVTLHSKGEMIWTRDGLQVCPHEDRIELSYSTRTCAEFYSIRGSVWPQACDAPQSALSKLETGLPFKSELPGCSAGLFEI